MTDRLDFLGDLAPLSLGALAERTGVSLLEGTDADQAIVRASAIDMASRSDVTVFEDGGDLDDLGATQAAACFVSAQAAAKVPTGTVALVCRSPSESFGRAAAILHRHGAIATPATATSIAPSAYVDARANLETGVRIEAYAVVGSRAEIGAGTVVGASSVIDAGVRIGRQCRIEAHVVIAHALIGDRVVICSGARLGVADALSSTSLGRVIVQDEVEIGANAVVERGALRDTVIGDHAAVAPLARLRGETMVTRGARIGFSSAVEIV